MTPRWTALLFFLSPVLFAQPLLYELSVPAVTTGTVQTAAISLQFVSPPLLVSPPPASPLNLTQQSNFVATGSPQPGYVLTFALILGGSLDNFSIGFQPNPTGPTINYNLAGILPAPAAPGTYLFPGSVALDPAGGGPVVMGSQLTATLTITAQAVIPTLQYSPSSLNFTFSPLLPLPPSQTVAITSSGSALSFTATPVNAGWLTVVASSSTTPATLTVTASPSSLGPGVYSGTIQLSAPGAANTLVSIPVSFTFISVTSGPVPYVSQISNSASYAPAGAPNSGIAQGSLFAIFGFNLGPSTLMQSGYPLTTNLGGTSVKVTVGSTSTDALLLYTSSGQVAAILSSPTATGTGTLVVTYNGTPGMSIPIKVVPSSFGTFTVPSNGLGPGIITGADYIVKTLSSPARPGDTLILWGTGLGAISGDESNPPTPVNLFSPQVLVGNTGTAKVAYAGRSSCCAGLDQINFVVPAGIEGCYVPVSVQSGGITSNFTSLPIASSGPCVPSPGFNATQVNTAVSGSGFKIGVIAVGPIPVLQSFGFPFDQATSDGIARVLGRKLDPADVRVLRQARLGTQEQQRTVLAQMMKKYGVRSASQAKQLEPLLRALLGNNSEGAFAAFGAFTGGGSYSSQLLTDLPPSGTCTAFPSLPTRAGGVSSARGLEAGAQLSLSSPAGSKTLARIKAGEYKVLLGSGFAVSQAPAGTYRVTGSGGADVGSFSASLNLSNSLSWMNENATNTVDRTQPLTVNWTGGPNPGHIIFGGIADTTGGAIFLCTEDAQKGSLTVPSQVLSVLPPTAAHHGYLFLMADPFENPFTAPGLDAGYFLNFSNDSREVVFQ